MNTRKHFTPTASPAIAPAIRLAESVEDFAARTGLGRTTVFKLIKDGELESIKVGRRRLIPSGAGERFLARLQAAV